MYIHKYKYVYNTNYIYSHTYITTICLELDSNCKKQCSRYSPIVEKYLGTLEIISALHLKFISIFSMYELK